MKITMTIIATLAAVAMIAVSALLNWLFLSSQAPTPFNANAFGVVSLSADAFKAVLPVLIAWGFAQKKWLYAFLATLWFFFVALFSTTNAVGFAGANRGEIVGARQTLAANLSLVGREEEEVEAKLDQIREHRPPEVVDELMKRLEQKKAWQTTHGCAEITLRASREFCDAYASLKIERAAGSEAAKLEPRLAELRANVTALRERGAGNQADPQASIIGDALSVDPARVRSWLVLLTAFLIEVGSAFGIILAIGHLDGFLARAHGLSAVKPKLAPLPAPSPALAVQPQAAPQTAAATIPAAPGVDPPSAIVEDDKAPFPSPAAPAAQRAEPAQSEDRGEPARVPLEIPGGGEEASKPPVRRSGPAAPPKNPHTWDGLDEEPENWLQGELFDEAASGIARRPAMSAAARKARPGAGPAGDKPPRPVNRLARPEGLGTPRRARTPAGRRRNGEDDDA